VKSKVVTGTEVGEGGKGIVGLGVAETTFAAWLETSAVWKCGEGEGTIEGTLI